MEFQPIQKAFYSHRKTFQRMDGSPLGYVVDGLNKLCEGHILMFTEKQLILHTYLRSEVNRLYDSEVNRLYD